MSAFTDKIAAEHGGWFNLDGVWRCNCGEPLPSSANADMWMRAHIAAVTEAAVREQVARDIGRRRDEAGGQPTSATGIALRAYIDGAFNEAARIARGGAV